MATKSAANLTIVKPGAMTEQGRKDVAAWLRAQAKSLVRDGKQYVDKGNFTARYLYDPRV
mgnify:CR=1